MTDAETRDPESATPYRWVMLALICVAYASFGMVQTSMAPLISAILRDTGLTRGQMGIALGSWQFIYLFVAIPAGVIIDRFGLRRAIFAGIVFVALSGVGRAAATGQASMIAAVMIFGLGGPFISIGAPKLTATWFPQRELGLALGIYTVSQSIGAMFATSTANAVIMPATGDSWRATLLVFAAIAAIGGLAWITLARDPRHSGAPSQATGPAAMIAAFRGLLGVPVVRVVLVMAVAVFVFNHSITNWLPEMLRSHRMSPSAAGFWASVPTLVAIGSALIVPRLTTARWLTPVLILVFALWATAALLLGAGGGPGDYVALVLLGIGRGAAVPLLMLTLLRARSVGPALMGAAGGLFFTAGEVGGVLGPAMTGALADATGGFSAGLLVLAATALLLCALVLALRAAAGTPAPEAAPAP